MLPRSDFEEFPVTYAPFLAEVQAHYDLSDEFFALFLDPSMTYSCAYFEREDMSLREAQQAKIDLALGKLNLKPGMTLLDIGCGWGALVRRASERHGVKTIGLTLSRNQFEHVQAQLGQLPTPCEVRLMGWEQFDEPVDRIVSIGAFEHFRIERFAAFFERCRRILPRDGRMLLHTIVMPSAKTMRDRGIEVTHEAVLFGKFIGKRIFPGGQLAAPETIERSATAAGFNVERVQSLQLHYARTLDQWMTNLAEQREKAIRIASKDVYDRYAHYLSGCAKHFRSGHVDVMQFTLTR